MRDSPAQGADTAYGGCQFNDSGTEEQLDRLLEMASRAPAAVDLGNAPLLVYGAGSRGREIKRVAERHGHRVAAFLDRGARPDACVDGVPVLLPDAPCARPEAWPSSHVVVSVFRHDIDIAEIVASLDARRFTHVHTFFDVYQRWPREFQMTYWLGPVEGVLRGAEPIRQAWARLGDDRSRRVLLDCLCLRTTGAVRALRAPEPPLQYLLSDPVFRERRARLIDGGAYDGDTIRALCNDGVPLEAVAAFEPDPSNFAALASFARSQPVLDLTLFPCGLWSRSCQLAFDATGNDGARLGLNGSTTIQCVALDDALPSFRPTLVKLDIEGAEPQALEGACSIIAKHRPALAVSAYHAPEHLWSLIGQVDSWNLGYRFALRYHGFQGFDVVLYAWPQGAWRP